MDVLNSTHVHWAWTTVTRNGNNGDFSDSFWVTKA